MEVEIALDLLKLNGPKFNQLESLKVNGLTRNHFNKIINTKSELCKKGIIFTQISRNLWFFRIDNGLSISKFINNCEEILNPVQISHPEIEKLTVEHEYCVFSDNFYHKNIVIPNILKEAFLCSIIRKNNIDWQIEYRENAVYIPNLKNNIVGFKFQFSIDENFDVYMFLDLLYDIEFLATLVSIRLPRSSKRIDDYEFFKTIIEKLSFFCGGKSYKYNPEIIIFNKIIEEREC